MITKPILFSPDMVRAILDGRKTMTRRVVNRLNGFGQITEFQESSTPLYYDWTFRNQRLLWNDIRHDRLMECCPYAAGYLWVREKWASVWFSHDPESGYADDLGNVTPTPKTLEEAKARNGYPLIYAADDKYGYQSTEDRGFRWLPSIHMPRWGSRITLKIESIRVERLQAISEEDARAEGPRPMTTWDEQIRMSGPLSYKDGFIALWDSINGERPGCSWDDDPWVWVVEFFPIMANVDEVLK